MNKLFLFLVLALGILANGWSQTPVQDPATQLKYLTEEYPPANYSENGKLTGISVILLKAIWKQLGVPEQPIFVVPWARGYSEVQNTPGTVLFTMSRTTSRESLFKWVGPLFVARHNLVAIKSNKIRIDSLGDAKKYLTAVIREDISEISMKANGFTEKNLAYANRLPQALDMLVSGRVQFVCVSHDGLLEYIKSKNLDLSLFVNVLNVNEMKNYYAFHKSTPLELISRFQKALDTIRPEHEQLLAKYGLSL